MSRKSPTGTSGDCQDEECCCGPLDTESVQVTCKNFIHINMTRVTRCGCGPCERRETVLKGNWITTDYYNFLFRLQRVTQVTKETGLIFQTQFILDEV